MRHSLSDLQLIEAANGGCQQAYGALVQRYRARLYKVAFNVLRERGDAEDAVQEAYVRAFTHLRSYEPTASLGAWLSRIVQNEALQLRRKRRRSPVSLEFEELEALAGPCASTEEHTIASEEIGHPGARSLLTHAINALPPDLRTVFVLRRIEDLSVRETAESLGINEITVRTRLHRAHRFLQTGNTQRLHHLRGQLFKQYGVLCDRPMRRRALATVIA
jgi:RNA polymerase sigma-70 factor (ECF subfamily)